MPRNAPKRAGRGAANDRCPRCKKVRKIWMRANEWHGDRVSFANVPGEGKVCWICRIREVDPKWRPGDAVPETLKAKYVSQA